MSKENLPEKVNPFRLAEANAVVHAVLKLQDMQRLRTMLADDRGEVVADLQFGVDQQGIKFMKCDFDTQVILQCQRCMEKFNHQLLGKFLVGLLLKASDAELLPEVYEPVLVEEGALSIHDVIEDELIVSLPIVPMHDLAECKVDPSRFKMGEVSVTEEQSNPFKVIEVLRKKRDANHHQE